MERELIARVASALAREPRVDLEHRRIRIFLDRGDLVLEGEVRDVAAKKLALERAAAVPGIDRIIDRLHVAADHPVADGELHARVCAALRGEPALEGFRLIPRPLELNEEPRLTENERGYVAVSVEDGVVTLDGQVTSLSHKRLAGALAWWIDGVRDVVNGLGVEPPEEDSDEEITDATRFVLEKDRSLHDEDVQVRTRRAVVELTGTVATPEEAERAERDAWAIFGVDAVENRLRVQRS